MQCYVLRRNKIIRSREIANAIARSSLSSSNYVTVQLLHSYSRSFVPLQHYYLLFILRYDSYDVEIFRISSCEFIFTLNYLNNYSVVLLWMVRLHTEEKKCS